MGFNGIYKYIYMYDYAVIELDLMESEWEYHGIMTGMSWDYFCQMGHIKLYFFGHIPFSSNSC